MMNKDTQVVEQHDMPKKLGMCKTDITMKTFSNELIGTRWLERPGLPGKKDKDDDKLMLCFQKNASNAW